MAGRVLTRADTSQATPRDGLRTGAALLAAGVILAVVFFAVGSGVKGQIPEFGRPVMANTETAEVPPGVAKQYLERSAAPDETGIPNSVTAVLLGYRAYDTLGEATVIFVSILGAYAILRQVGRSKAREEATS